MTSSGRARLFDHVGLEHLWLVARGRGVGADRSAFGHVALTAAGRAAVDAAFAAAIANGGREEGPPGPRPQYGPSYYAAYMADPDGYRVEVVSGGS